MNSKTKKANRWALSFRRKMAVSFIPLPIFAAAKYRYETLKADRALVFSDTRQSQHMQQAWLITRKAGYVPDSFSLEHKKLRYDVG